MTQLPNDFYDEHGELLAELVLVRTNSAGASHLFNGRETDQQQTADKTTGPTTAPESQLFNTLLEATARLLSIRRYGGHPLLSLGASTSGGGSPRPPTGQSCLDGADLLAQVVASGLDPDGVVDNPVHERIDMDTAPEPLVSARLEAMTADHRPAGSAWHVPKKRVQATFR